MLGSSVIVIVAGFFSQNWQKIVGPKNESVWRMQLLATWPIPKMQPSPTSRKQSKTMKQQDLHATSINKQRKILQSKEKSSKQTNKYNYYWQ